MKYDCIFLGMTFLNEDIPKDKVFLFKYFKKDIQETFLRYIIFFGDYKNFIDHTGLMCEEKWLKKLYKKYIDLIYAHYILKKQADIEKLSTINSGKLKIYSSKRANYIIKDYL
jgi:hypothetical protein